MGPRGDTLFLPLLIIGVALVVTGIVLRIKFQTIQGLAEYRQMTRTQRRGNRASAPGASASSRAAAKLRSPRHGAEYLFGALTMLGRRS
jgi:hypothetical protein